MQLSALSGAGVDALWQAALAFRASQNRLGQWAGRRQRQALAWMWERIDAGLRHAFRASPGVQARLPDVSAAVVQGRRLPSAAALELLGLSGIMAPRSQDWDQDQALAPSQSQSQSQSGADVAPRDGRPGEGGTA